MRCLTRGLSLRGHPGGGVPGKTLYDPKSRAMKLSLKVICVFIVVSVQSASGQSMLKLFEKEIPAALLKTELQRESVNLSLEAYARLNPEILYYYLTNLQLQFGKKIVDRDSNFANAFSVALHRNRHALATWAEGQIESAEARIDERLTRREVISHLSDYMLEFQTKESSSNMPAADSNAVECCEYIFLSGLENQFYDRNTNYRELCARELRTLLGRFRQAFDAAECLDRNTRELLLDSALNAPYVFQPDYLKDHGITPSLQMYEWIERIISDNYRPKARFALQVGVDLFPREFDERYFLYDPFVRGYNKEFHVRLQLPLIVSVMAQFPTRDRLVPFSHITFALGFSPSASLESETLGGTQVFQGGRAFLGGYFLGRYFLSEVLGSHSSIIFGEFRTPIFYLSENSDIEIGAGYRYQKTSLNYRLIRDGLLSLDPPLGPLESSEAYEFTDRHSAVYGLVSVNLHLILQVYLTAEYLIPETAGIRLSYAFGL